MAARALVEVRSRMGHVRLVAMLCASAAGLARALALLAGAVGRMRLWTGCDRVAVLSAWTGVTGVDL